MTDDTTTDPVAGHVMTTSEVMTWLGLSRPALVAQIQAGDVPASRIGGEYRFWRPTLLRQFFGQEQAVEPGRDVITPDDLAERLRLSAQTVRSRIADGSIPASKFGNQWRIWWPTILGRLEKGEDFPPTPASESSTS